MHEALARANFDQDVAALGDAAAAFHKLIVHARDLPSLMSPSQHTKPLRLRFQGDGLDDLPPAIALLKPDGTPWTAPLPGGVFNAGRTPIRAALSACAAPANITPMAAM